ncbi:hypothetical protein F5Y17DRAFT_423923 [Xylariaceae sp. FL0594]|nr:hypothetical protein F5Y17DRAFT_423923 [Xylariaceae sp. FL0594]
MPAMSDPSEGKVLLIGFKPDITISRELQGRFGTASEIAAKLDADHARIQRAGIAPVVFRLDPREQEKGLQALRSLLGEERYEAIGIGAGVRFIPEHTALFETIVNLCIAMAPGVPLMFNDGPGGNAETVQRVLGVQIP